MKRILSLLFVLLMLTSAFLVSCGKEPVDTTSGDTTTPTDTKEFYASETYHAAIEMPSRVLLLQAGGPWYYSKVDGESYVFCFDPLCDHSVTSDCLSRKFLSTSAIGCTVAYSEKENRVYLTRGQHLYSTSFDASDLRLECSLGEDGLIGDKDYQGYISWLRCTENYLFFLYNNDDTGHTQLMRYDTSRKKLQALTSPEAWVVGYETADGYIYVRMLTENNEPVCLTADYDFENRRIVSDPINLTLGISMGVYDGEYFYERASEKLFKINPLTDEKSLVSDDALIDGAQILAVHDGWIYFVSAEMKKIGEQYNELLGMTRDILLSNYRLYRISLDGKIELMLELPGSIDTLNFVDGGAVIHIMSLYDENGEYVLTKTGPIFVYYQLGKDGGFADPKLVGNAEGNKELIDYFRYGIPEIVDTTETTTAESTIEPTKPTEPTASTIDVTTLPIVGEYTNLRKEVPFIEFLSYDKVAHLNENDPYSVDKILTHGNHDKTPMNFIIVTILGYAGVQPFGLSSIPVYYVNVERYGEGCIDSTVYKMGYTDPQTPQYGCELLEIGERYLTYNLNSTYKKDPEKIFLISDILRMEEYDGEKYVYNVRMLREFAHLPCAIKITDPIENLVYRPGENDDVIAYMKKNGITPPTYDYKCKLDDYVQALSNSKYKIDDLPVVGEYTSILKQVPFESFAELPLDMRLDPDNPYLIKEKKNILDCYDYEPQCDKITVLIAGYIGEEIGDDGMIYSYYYVYVDLNSVSAEGNGPWTTINNNVYVMKAYGSPAHPYYGQQRYEIGDILLRYQTDIDELHSGTLSPTSMFLVDSSRKYYRFTLLYPDFDFSLDISALFNPGAANFDLDLYLPKRADDIIAYMESNGIDMPKFDKGGNYMSWDSTIQLLSKPAER